MTKLIIVFVVSILLAGISFVVYTAKTDHAHIPYPNKDYQPEENEEHEIELNDKRAAFNEKFEVPQKLYYESMKKIMTAPSEENYTDFVSTNFWSCIGPFGHQIQGTAWTHNGRCTDFKFENSNGTLVGTSQGGLWKAASTPICLTDNMPAMSISTFDVDLNNANKIVVGTGDYSGSGSGISYLSGVWVTTNSGDNWVQANTSSFPDYVYKIRYSGISGIWYLSASQGFYRSTDGGLNWTATIFGWSSDFDFDGFNVYAAVKQSGIWKSTDGGANFNRLTGLDAAVNPNLIGDMRISVAQSLTSRVYVNITNGTTVGVYKTENSGTTWQNTNIGADIHYGQGLHNNAIAISPVNPDLILAGGGAIFRTTNNGNSWLGINAPTEEYHTDITRIVWKADGTEVYITSDGGFHRSSNGGLNWTSINNNLPAIQFYNIDVAVKNNSLWVIGASQDNSISLVKNATLNYPGTWSRHLGGDGGDVCLLEENPDYMLASNWGSGDYVYRSSNAGSNWLQVISQPQNNGVRLDDDRTGPNAWFYRSLLGVVSKSTDFGATWSPVGGGGNFASSVFNLNVCKYNGDEVVYITTSAGNRNIWVYESTVGNWQNRFTNLPVTQFSKVAVHPRNSNFAYALVATPGEPNSIFKTTNRGISWSNVTGDLQTIAGPGILVRDLVPHPANDNLLYIGTNFGCWRTTNGGVNWHRWNYAMPMGNDIRDMEFIDSAGVNKFYIIAGTNGRGVWTRDASSDDPNAVINNSNPVKYSLYQNFPNPFNPSTTIRFDLPVSGFVEIKVYDISGRIVRTLVDNKMNAGTHEIIFNGSDLASGVYFYELKTPRNTDVKKMILVK